MRRKHVAPHLWAELDRLPAERTRLFEQHAADCERCARARDRVAIHREVFADMASAEPADLEWDHIGARIHWSRSLERRSGERAALSLDDTGPRSRRGRMPSIAALVSVAVGGAVAAAALALALWPEGDAALTAGVAVDSTPAAGLDAVAVELAETQPLTAMVVSQRGDGRIDGAPIRWDERIGVGAVVETGDGSMTLQFGHGSGLTLGPRSRLQLRSFDSRSVEIVLDGEIDVVVARREPGQQFVVVTGKRSVTVRGTGFHVDHRRGELAVSCEHGRVDVTDGVTNRAVPSRTRLRLAASQDLLADAEVGTLTDERLESLRDRLALPLLPAWTGADAAFESSSALMITARPGDAVLIDGASVGAGSLAIRLLSGRHQIAVGARGEWAKGRWVELTGGDDQRLEVDATTGAADADVEKRAAEARSRRRAELRDTFARTARLRRCVARLEKHGVAKGTFARFDVGVNADGSFGFVNISSSNVSLQTRTCLLDAAGSLSLTPGHAARLKLYWRY